MTKLNPIYLSSLAFLISILLFSFTFSYFYVKINKIYCWYKENICVISLWVKFSKEYYRKTVFIDLDCDKPNFYYYPTRNTLSQSGDNLLVFVKPFSDNLTCLLSLEVDNNIIWKDIIQLRIKRYYVKEKEDEEKSLKIMAASSIPLAVYLLSKIRK